MPYRADVKKALRVLIVDDDPALGVLIGKALARRGHSATPVADSRAALELLASEDMDVIALDHELPENRA